MPFPTGADSRCGPRIRTDRDPKIGSTWKHVCTVIDILIWVVFVVEFFPRVVLAERRIQHAAGTFWACCPAPGGA
jgi:hypothetical protein